MSSAVRLTSCCGGRLIRYACSVCTCRSPSHGQRLARSRSHRHRNRLRWSSDDVDSTSFSSTSIVNTVRVSRSKTCDGGTKLAPDGTPAHCGAAAAAAVRLLSSGWVSAPLEGAAAAAAAALAPHRAVWSAVNVGRWDALVRVAGRVKS